MVGNNLVGGWHPPEVSGDYSSYQEEGVLET